MQRFGKKYFQSQSLRAKISPGEKHTPHGRRRL